MVVWGGGAPHNAEYADDEEVQRVLFERTHAVDVVNPRVTPQEALAAPLHVRLQAAVGRGEPQGNLRSVAAAPGLRGGRVRLQLDFVHGHDAPAGVLKLEQRVLAVRLPGRAREADQQRDGPAPTTLGAVVHAAALPVPLRFDQGEALVGLVREVAQERNCVHAEGTARPAVERNEPARAQVALPPGQVQEPHRQRCEVRRRSDESVLGARACRGVAETGTPG